MCHEFLYFYFFHDRTPIQPPGKRHGAWLCGVMNIVKSDSALWCTQKLLISLFHGVIHTAGFFEKFYYLDCEVRRTMHITEFLKNSNFSTKSKPKLKKKFCLLIRDPDVFESRKNGWNSCDFNHFRLFPLYTERGRQRKLLVGLSFDCLQQKSLVNLLTTVLSNAKKISSKKKVYFCSNNYINESKQATIRKKTFMVPMIS